MKKIAIAGLGLMLSVGAAGTVFAAQQAVIHAHIPALDVTRGVCGGKGRRLWRFIRLT